MLSVDEARDRAADLVALARAAGADAADSVYAASGSTAVQVRLGALEDVERSEGEEIGLRVFVGRRSASVSGSDMSPDALATLAERCVAMARLAPEDPYAGLAPEELLSRGATPALDIDDGGEVSPESLRDAALAAENAGRSIAGVTNSQGASASGGRSVTALATSHGFAAAYAGSSHGVSAQMLAGEGASMQRDYQYSSARYRSDLDDPAKVGTEAGQRAVSRLNPERLKSGTLPIVFDRRVSASLVGHLAAAINGASVARGTTFLKDRLGQRIFDGSISVVDDPLRARGLRSRPHDGEGLPTHVTRLIDNGVLSGWIADTASARQLGIAPTGHASRGVSGPPGAGLSNVHLEAGSVSVADLIADIGEGFLVTELIGQGVNTLTGDYSRGASGFAIRGGEIVGPVDGVTIAGNLKDMFASLTPADDLVFEHAVNVPTLRVDGMTLAGE